MTPGNSRRDFLKAAGLSAAAAATGCVPALGRQQPGPAQTAIPRWRGFNLLNFFQALSRGERSDLAIEEDDCRWIRDWGFDFIRIPMDYWLWIDSDWQKTRRLRPDDVLKIKESALEQVDRTVDLGKKYGLHVSLNFHRAPGWCINDREREPFSLWKDKPAEDAFVFHWELFAKRYRGVAASDLSLNLVNEAPQPREGFMSREDYCRVMTRATEAIRAVSPDRLVIIDGLSVGNEPVDEMIPTGVAQSVHAYWPGQISHYRASWVDRNASFPEPTWPILNRDGSVKMGRAEMEKHYAPWGELARKGIGVHCGEAGCYNKTPYDVFTAWLTDVMEILKGHGIGYALWNFRGSFGILDSGRKDVAYEDWHGHQLDRKLLALLQEH
ncbi:MAG TPA: cellulase family glycosylhydrolase [Thermoguttaceae bacterium]|nr:cellulase family glycosylhydrolase [Thermoguttaceae bacterium]